jgi:hypothetical protein
MPALVNFGDTEILSVMRAVLLELLPPGVDVIRAFGNRVPEPLGPDFCVLTPLRRERLSTNRDSDIDIQLIGGIAVDTLTVTSGPALQSGYRLYGPTVTPGTVVTAALPAPGLIASYTVTPAQSVAAGSRLYAGRHAMMQPADCVYQCDVHGPGSSANVMTIATAWRDEYGCQRFADASGALEMQPLYADDPHMAGFANAESQWEDRWIVDLHVQANIIVSVDQEFFDEVRLDLFPVDLLIVP